MEILNEIRRIARRSPRLVASASARWIARGLAIGVMLAGTAATLAQEPTGSGQTSLERLARELDLTPQLRSPSATDPLRMIANGMTDVHQDLSRYQTNQPVQEKERRVVKSLDELIAALERHCRGNGGNRPGNGRRESVIVSGAVGSGDLHSADKQGRQWGQLPPKQRAAILQSQTEGFPPGYEGLLQSYYQQLSREQSGDTKPADQKPAADLKPADAPPAKPAKT